MSDGGLPVTLDRAETAGDDGSSIFFIDDPGERTGKQGSDIGVAAYARRKNLGLGLGFRVSRKKEALGRGGGFRVETPPMAHELLTVAQGPFAADRCRRGNGRRRRVTLDWRAAGEANRAACSIMGPVGGPVRVTVACCGPGGLERRPDGLWWGGPAPWGPTAGWQVSVAALADPGGRDDA